MRDYGTGSWVGGDDDGCDHAKQTARAPHERKSSTLDGGTDTIRVQEEANVYRDVCGKCGARRVDQQLGLEPTPDEYVANMVAVFREVRRVLRRDGTCWLNIGDSYSAQEGQRKATDKAGAKQQTKRGSTGSPSRSVAGLKPKDLVGIPWRLAFALQADGWYLRSDIIWSKPNPMPESVTDRPTKAHEYLFLLSRSPRYFYDADAIREPAEWARWGDQTNGKHEGSGSAAGWIGSKTKAELMGRKSDAVGVNGRNVQETNAEAERRDEVGGSFNNNPRLRSNVGRNKRSVWEIATEPYPDAHFATFPQALVEPCVLAGTSERGCCPVCGAPWERETSKDGESAYEAHKRVSGETWRDLNARHESQGKALNGTGKNTPGTLNRTPRSTTGWRPTCDHGHAPVPCTVADIFMGSGTTALVARKLGRRTIGIELSREYADLAATRLQQLSLLAEGAA